MPLAFSAACLISAIILILPGWALLSATGAWSIFRPLQRWIVAFGISASFFPVLYYLVDKALPAFRLGTNKLWFVLASFLISSLVFQRKQILQQFRFEPLEWAAVAIFAVTLFTRLWMIHDHPYPAWTDSLHHTLLTLLTAQQGGLPTTLAPYAPTPLDMYHLGLYALTAPVMLLSGAEAATALLVVVQILNGLCGAGVYLLLDRSGHRLGALVGLAIAGLFSLQPAWYFNWGRDTQLASQVVLLIALVLTLLAVENHPARISSTRWARIGLVIAAGLANAAVFLLHFRVAGFYLPLLAIVLVWQSVTAFQKHAVRLYFLRILIVGLVSIAFCLPALVSALPAYIQSRTASGVGDISYYQVTLEALLSVGLHRWLAATAAAALILGMVLRNRISWWMLAWIACLAGFGFAYLTGIRMITLTNIGAVLIMLYLPASLAVGAAVSSLLQKFNRLDTKPVLGILTILLMAGGILAARDRIQAVEPFRYFVQPADVIAMDWINTNTPSDAVFAVNTWFWLTNAPHGTDAGY